MTVKKLIQTKNKSIIIIFIIIILLIINLDIFIYHKKVSIFHLFLFFLKFVIIII